jgi:uncharacterized OB-fold protein
LAKNNEATEQVEPGYRPIVPYLELPSDDLDDAYLKALVNKDGTAAYLYSATRRYDSKNADLDETSLQPAKLENEGEIWVYTIVHQSFPGVPTPFMGAIVDVPVEGHPDLKVAVRANIAEVEVDPSAVEMGMKVKFRARAIRKDQDGNDVVIPEFVPV